MLGTKLKRSFFESRTKGVHEHTPWLRVVATLLFPSQLLLDTTTTTAAATTTTTATAAAAATTTTRTTPTFI